MLHKNFWIGFAGLALLVAASACGDDESNPASDGGTGGTTSDGGGGSGASGGNDGGGGATADATLTLSLSGLEPLGDGYVYEGWLIVDDTPVSAGRFNVQDGVSDYTAMVSADDAAAATTYVLTIEPDSGDDPAPSEVHVLGGDIANGGATLSVGHAAALGDDLTSLAGSYILETPSSSGIAADFDQGIWWLMMPGPAASLTLPTLPAGWTYEGWVAGPNGPVSTGRFSTAAGADEDGTGADAGPDAGPPFPGQDFIDPAVVIAGGDHAAVISIEPVPDDSAAPFAIKPLIDMTIEDVGAGVSQDMTNMAANAPTGELTISI